MELFGYLLKSAAILGLFYLVYWIALRKHTMFRANRQYFLCGIIAALTLPLFQFTQTVYLPAPVVEQAVAIPVEMLAVEAVIPPKETTHIDWQMVLLAVYGLGVLISLLRFVYHSWALLRVLKAGNYQKRGGYYHVQTEQQLAPFSFFKYLVYNPKLHSEEDLQMIIQHEKAHAKGWHSLDVLMGNLLIIVHWLNPMAWWYKKSMVQNLEFIADRDTVAEIPSKKAYQLALVKASTQGQQLQLSNSFYQSFIKNRIVMLNTNQSQKAKRWRLLLIVPLLALFMYSFNVDSVVEYVGEAESSSLRVFQLSADMTVEELKQLSSKLNDQAQGMAITIEQQIRNDRGLLTGLQIINSFEQNGQSSRIGIKGPENDIIKDYELWYEAGPRLLVRKSADKDHLIISTPEELIVKDPDFKKAYTNKVGAAGVTLSQGKQIQVRAQAVNITTKSDEQGKFTFPTDPIYIVNGKTYKQLPQGKNIVTEGSITYLDAKDGQAQYGPIGKDGVMVVHGEATFVDKAEPKSTTVKPMAGFKDITLVISADMSRTVLTEKIQYLKQKHDINLDIRDITYNKEGKIVDLDLTYSAFGNSGSYSINNNGKPIEDVVLSFDRDGSFSAGNRNSEALRAERAARMEARGYALKARKLARADEMEARKAELALRKEEMKAIKTKMAGMSDERKAEMKAQLDARKAELAKTQGLQKAEMKAKIDALRAQEKAMVAKQKELAKRVNAAGYAKVASGAAARGIAASIAGDVYIDKNTTDADLEQIKKELAAENVSFSFKRVRRNARGEITGIKITVDNNKGATTSTNIKGSDKPIEPIHLEY